MIKLTHLPAYARAALRASARGYFAKFATLIKQNMPEGWGA